MCGVIGILLADRDAQVSPELYDGLTILQHRGQDAAGIATSDGRKMFLRKDKGLVGYFAFIVKVVVVIVVVVVVVAVGVQ